MTVNRSEASDRDASELLANLLMFAESGESEILNGTIYGAVLKYSKGLDVVMIMGVGTDLLEINRIRMLCGDPEDAFLRKTFTAAERQQAAERPDPVPYFASRFAGKEAVFKSLGVGGDDIRLDDIEILGDATGRPCVTLHGRAKNIAAQKDICDIRISLSSDCGMVMAFAVAQSE